MKKYILIAFFASFGLFFSSCEEVIDVDLNDADPVLVIEANLDVGARSLTVQLTRTASFFDNSPAVPVTDAAVVLDIEGTGLGVPHVGNGLYEVPVPVSQGQRLELQVRDGVALHTAEAIVPRLIPVDSLSTEYFEPNSFFDGGSIVSVNFQEPAGERNFIRVRLFSDGEEFDSPDDIIVEEDLLSDGEYVNYPLFGYFFAGGEEVELILQSVPEATFEYYSTLEDIVVFQGGGGTAAPANPSTNIEGGALGIFNVYHADTTSIVVPQP